MSYQETGETHPMYFDVRRVEDSEVTDWTPVVTLRPHHLLKNSAIKRALSGKHSTGALRAMVYGVGQYLNVSGYSRDVVGSSPVGVVKFFKEEAKFLKKLRDLPEEAVVQLDLAKDNWCNSCKIGKHCTATNLASGYSFRNPANVPVEEQKYVSYLHRALLGYGYRRDVDFTFRDTEHEFYDYGGRFLNEVDDPERIAVSFSSMLVKMGALKAVINNLDKPLPVNDDW